MNFVETLLRLPCNMEQSTTLDIEALKMTQEQYMLASQSLHLQPPGCGAGGVHPVGLYGWRKRCFYFFLLLLLVIMIVNLALTVWIIKVMNFTVDGMGTLRLNEEGIRLEGISEFLLPLYMKEIRSRGDSPLVLRSEKNVTVNARNSQGQLTGQLTVGEFPTFTFIKSMLETARASSLANLQWLYFHLSSKGLESVEAHCQKLEIHSKEGRLLFSASEEEVSIKTQKLTVTGSEGAVFSHSVETPLILASGASEDLKLESPTRTLTMEAPRGVELSSTRGGLKASGRKDLHFESTEGEILLDASTIRLGSLPLGMYSASKVQASHRQTVFEVCVCPSGKLYLSPAESRSTCQDVSNICLWS